MIYVKMHNTDKGVVLAMCDAELIDKVLTEGDVEINIRDYSDFYRGELMGEREAKKAVSNEGLYSANIVGRKSVDVAVEKAIIDDAYVRKVGNVPYAQAFNVRPA